MHDSVREAWFKEALLKARAHDELRIKCRDLCEKTDLSPAALDLARTEANWLRKELEGEGNVGWKLKDELQ